MWLERNRRELLTAGAYAGLLAWVGLFAPDFFSRRNIWDIVVNNVPVLVAAIGMTMVVLTRQIDISIGSQFAICGVVAGLLAKAGAPMPLVAVGAVAGGTLLGTVNGVLAAGFGLPSIVVTLAGMFAFRETLRWATEGADIYGLPESFQWLGMSQRAGQATMVLAAAALLAGFAWGLRYLAAGRAVYATGSDAAAARLVGIRPARVTFWAFVLMGALTGLAALLSSIRFPQIQTNAGMGFELQVIAAVVVGGTAISGGRGSLFGTLIGVALLGTIGNALTFLKVSSNWEKAIQGAIILTAVSADALEAMRRRARTATP